MFLSQDARPENDRWLENPVRPLLEGSANTAYPRQVALPDTHPLKAYAHATNDPPVSTARSLHDVPRLGIRAYAFSNVSSAVLRHVFDQVGGFPSPIVLNGDSVLASRILRAGGTVADVAESVVEHSHACTLSQQGARYFGIGVSHVEAAHHFVSGTTTKAGATFALGMVMAGIRHRHPIIAT